MSNRKKGKGLKVVIITLVILFLLVIGLFFGVYGIMKDADKQGVQFDGEWTYKGDVALDVNHDESTYTLKVGDIQETGKIVKIDLVKEDLENSIFKYEITLSGDGNHVVNVTIDDSGDKAVVMTFNSGKYSEIYEFEQVIKDSE